MSTESVFDFFIHEEEYRDLDLDGAAQRLSAALRCESTSASQDSTPFYQLHDLMRRSYPKLMTVSGFEVLDRSVLITLPGEDASLQSVLFMSHLDVVPVVEGTESDWHYPPFSGAIAEGYIWGRGALDIKCQVFGVLEAAEYLLNHGKTFSRTVYFAFGQDEETFNTGAKVISDLLLSRGVRLAFLLDEGGGEIIDGKEYGAPGVFVSPINLMEKGYADLELSVESVGGHSSCPFGGTSLGRLSKAIASILDMPLPVELSPVMRMALETLRPYICEAPLSDYLSNMDVNAELIAAHCLSNRTLFPQVTTTVAPTMIMGSSQACNVMPQNMSAVINFRISCGHTPEEVMELARSAVNDPSVSLRFLQANPPSQVARTDGVGYSALVEAMSHAYRNIVYMPYTTAGATDARQYEQICDTCLRCSPFVSPESDLRTGVHGTDERISLRSYAQGIRVLIRLISNTCLSSSQ